MYELVKLLFIQVLAGTLTLELELLLDSVSTITISSVDDAKMLFLTNT